MMKFKFQKNPQKSSKTGILTHFRAIFTQFRLWFINRGDVTKCLKNARFQAIFVPFSCMVQKQDKTREYHKTGVKWPF